MNERKDGFLVVRTSRLRATLSQMQGKRLPLKEIVKLAVIPCVWKLFHKSRGGQYGLSFDPLFFEWVESEKIKNCDFEYFVKSHSIASEYLAYEKNALTNWEMFRSTYLEAFPDANNTELEKPETETKKKRKQRTVLDTNKKAEIITFAKANPTLSQSDLEKYFNLGRGTISKNRELVKLIKGEWMGDGRSCCKTDGTAYSHD